MSSSPKHSARECLVAGLRRQLDRWEAGRPSAEAGAFSSGTAALDRLLAGGGLRHGMLVEWVGECRMGNAECGMGNGKWGLNGAFRIPHSTLRNSPGGGAATLSLIAAREACREGGVLVVVDRRRMFYPPAAAAWGVDLRRLVVVHPRDRRDELWAMVQSLRSPAVAAVWAMIDRVDQRAFRRLQLAAQAGRTLGLLLRPADAGGQPSWADVRLGVGGEQGAGGRGQGAGGRGQGTGGGGHGVRNDERAGSRAPTRSVGRTPAHPKLQIANCKLPIRLLPPSGSRLSTLDSRLVHVRVLRTRRGRAGAAAVLEIDDAAHVVREVVSSNDANPLPVAAQLADPAAPSRPARAQ